MVEARKVGRSNGLGNILKTEQSEFASELKGMAKLRMAPSIGVIDLGTEIMSSILDTLY